MRVVVRGHEGLAQGLRDTGIDAVTTFPESFDGPPKSRDQTRAPFVPDSFATKISPDPAVLSAPPLDDPAALWVHELVGAEVVDTAGLPLGTVDAVQANPASDLLVLAGGGLVPLRFVVAHEPGRVTVDPPPGLLD